MEKVNTCWFCRFRTYAQKLIAFAHTQAHDERTFSRKNKGQISDFTTETGFGGWNEIEISEQVGTGIESQKFQPNLFLPFIFSRSFYRWSQVF